MITEQFLVDHGFETNHPDNVVLKKYYKVSKENPEWRVMVEQGYIPLTNKLTYNISCWKCNEQGAIIKRTSISNASTLDDLYSITKLCDITID